ncbi:hypothetical protein AVEN_199955-1 [Araneus ventricosus]|uniref:Uncharacterized protein n=1 Tax=Araneus ventricosus TaxID=182803 RepID=A0A4Y2BW42_ARAVE|nr:hypothetical protein AVEN_199955-1 [Araneus ventricosus]
MDGLINTKKYAKQFWPCKNELYLTKKGLICRGSHFVVPNESRTEVLEKIHASHKENGKMYVRNRFFIREDKSNKFYENVRTPEDFYSSEEQETVVMPDNNQQNTVVLPNNAQPTSRFGRKLTQPKRYGFE